MVDSPPVRHPFSFLKDGPGESILGLGCWEDPARCWAITGPSTHLPGCVSAVHQALTPTRDSVPPGQWNCRGCSGNPRT